MSEIKAFDDYFDEKLLEPYGYICKIPGKQVRTKLIQSFNYWLGIPNEKLIAISEIIEILHNSSLLIDDIEDSSKLRRGIPVAHMIYGIPWTINAANFAYFIGLQKAIDLGHDQATKIYSGSVCVNSGTLEVQSFFRQNCDLHLFIEEQLLELHRGQGMDIWFRDNFTCPTEDEYKTMVYRKTGALFGLAIRLMQLFSNSTKDFQRLYEKLGLLFQIRDDFANLCSKEYIDNKSYCEDLTEGKFSFPIIHGIKSSPNDNRLYNIIKQRTTDIDLKKYTVKLLEDSGSLEYTVKVLKNLKLSILGDINEIGTNVYLETLVKDLSKIFDNLEPNEGK